VVWTPQNLIFPPVGRIEKLTAALFVREFGLYAEARSDRIVLRHRSTALDMKVDGEALPWQRAHMNLAMEAAGPGRQKALNVDRLVIFIQLGHHSLQP